MKKKLLCLSPLPDAVVLGLFTMKAGPEQAELITAVTLARESGREELIEAVRDAEFILGDYTMNTLLDAEVLKAAERCQLIQQPSAGYQHIDVDAAQAEGIPVANVAGANSVSVAEHTIMAALALLKKLIIADEKTKAAEWVQDDLPTIGVFDLAGRTFGIIGMGRIGREVAKRATAFECNIVYYDIARLPDETEAELGVAYKPIDELLAESDVISIHTPLTPETENLLSEERIAGIKHNAVVINVARGGVVDEAAMAAALKEERIDGAAFDVFTTEPIAKDNPLLGAPKTILTPHIAGATNESRLRIIDFAIGNIARALAGEKPEDMIDDVPWPRPTA